VDPYGTAGMRERVLAAWTASPARLREDANAEEDYALGGYRDRVIVELAQNAADAATRVGAPGRLLFRLRDGVLTAANTGVPLDAAGVEALSTLRASDKRDRAEAAVGRFGVGFSAVVAVTDEPAIASRAADAITGVMWSAVRTRELVAGIPELAVELERREGHVSVLRLPFPLNLPRDLAPGVDISRMITAEMEGFDTVVRLPLRDAAAADLVRRQLEETGPALLLALPALGRIDIDLDGTLRTLTAVHGDGTATINGATWRTAEAHGVAAAELLADRPTEERFRPGWRLRWAIADVPGLMGNGGRVERALPDDVPAVVHAPTPSAEPLGLPALLIASFPLAPDRRHVADGPLTEFLIERAAEAYLNLLCDLPATPRLLDLVPGPVAAGALDARIRRAILARLPDTPLLPPAAPDPADEQRSASTGEIRLRGRETVAVDGPAPLVELLADVVAGLLPASWPVRHQAMSALGVRRMELADVIDELAALDRSPRWWHDLYTALAGVDTDVLGALPVPLADGRLVRGPRGLLVAADELDPATLAVLELRFVHPEAAHPLLGRLSAAPAGPGAVLVDPAVRAAVAGSYDADDPGAIADAVLTLVTAAHVEPDEQPWLAELALPGEDGELYPAGELMFPDAPLRDVVAADAPFGVVDPALVERYGTGPLEVVGVLRTFGLLREQDVPLTDLDLHLDDQEGWVGDVLARLPEQDVPPMISELSAVRDLELVERWDRALELLAAPPLRAAVVEPAQVLLADGRRVPVPSYTAWWLRQRPVLDGRRPDGLRSPDADPILTGLYDVAPADLDPALFRAFEVRTSLAEVLSEPDDLLARLADPGRTVSRTQLRGLWAALAGVDHVTPPERLRALVDGQIEVVPADDVLVLDNPALLPLLSGQPLVIAPYELAADLAELLDLPLAGEEITADVESIGKERPVPEAVREILPVAPATYQAHDPLLVAGRSVPWWCEGEIVHVGEDETSGLARGLAWAAGRWSQRLLLEAVLRSPNAAAVLLAESDLEP
jgi:hypothetical protein